MNWAPLLLGFTTPWLVISSLAEMPIHPGVAYVFFNESDFRRPAESGVQSRIRMETQGHDFAWLWLGKIQFPQATEVSFVAEADGGLRLFVGDTLLIDSAGPGETRSGKIRLARAQALPFRLEYYHRGGEAHLRLFWQWEGHGRELLPTSALGHDDQDVRLAQAIREGKTSVAPGGQTVIQAPAGDELLCATIYRPQDRPARDGKPIQLGHGPHLFLDEYLIEQSTNLRRRVNTPQRDPEIPNPLVTGKEDECNGPYLTVLRDSNSGRFRLWYNTNKVKFKDGSSHVAYLESEDGIHWLRPHRVLADPGGFDFGCSILDDAARAADPGQRYKLAWWHGGGMRLAVSPDGLAWTAWKPYPVIRQNHDITNIFRDSARNRYVATVSVYTTGKTWSGQRRVTMHTASPDLLSWQKPWYVLTPDDRIEPGQTQFYAMCGYLQRGDLLLGLVKVLHDDWKAPGTPPQAYGVGYTTLAWSRDGQHWSRDLEPFFEPDPKVDAWDHAHTWIDQQLPVGNQVYLYYGGYKFGHKMDRWEGRQIGLVRIARDRYVSRDAGTHEGMLRTPPVVLGGTKLTVNASIRGQLRAGLLDQAGTPLPGFGLADCQTVHGDDLDHEIRWKAPLGSLAGKVVRLEFRLSDGRLYGFGLVP